MAFTQEMKDVVAEVYPISGPAGVLKVFVERGFPSDYSFSRIYQVAAEMGKSKRYSRQPYLPQDRVPSGSIIDPVNVRAGFEVCIDDAAEGSIAQIERLASRLEQTERDMTKLRTELTDLLGFIRRAVAYSQGRDAGPVAAGQIPAPDGPQQQD